MNKKNGCGMGDASGSARYTAGCKLGRSVLSRPLFTVHRSLSTVLALFLLAALAPQAQAAVSAAGGTVTNYFTTNGVTYAVHIFSNSGNFVVTSTGDVDVLVVAGGGGGGWGQSGLAGASPVWLEAVAVRAAS